MGGFQGNAEGLGLYSACERATKESENGIVRRYSRTNVTNQNIVYFRNLLEIHKTYRVHYDP